MTDAATNLRHGVTELPGGPRVHHVEQGDPDGVPVVLGHGWPDSWFSWSRVLPLLDPRLHVLAYDQRGFGDSDHPSGGYEIDDLADDLARFWAARGLQRPHLVGHSLGTFVVRRAAERHPDAVGRLVLVDSAHHPQGAAMEEVLAIVSGLPEPVPETFVREFQESTVHHPVPEAFFERIVAESRKVPARVYRDVFASVTRFDDRSLLALIRAPTLLLWGEADALFDRRQEDDLLAALPDASPVVLPDTGHCPNWERPQEVAARMNEFVLGA